MPNPTIVSAALSDEKLRESISKLVEDYKNSLDDMKTATTNAVNDIKDIIASIGSTKVDFSGTLDGLEKAKKKMTTAASGGGTTTPAKDGYADNTIGALEESIRLEKEKRREMELGSNELRDQNQLIDDQKKKLKQETESLSTKLEKLMKTRIGNAISLPSRTLQDAETKLTALESLMAKMRNSGFVSTQQINRVQNAIDSVKNKIERLRSKRPMTMQEVLGMDENSIEAIARKMQALKRVTIDPKNAQQVKQLGEEYTKLGKLQNEYLGKNLLIQKSNHMLASTFGYIRNRIIYAFTLGALASFFRDLRNIRAEYEMLDRSLGILVGDFEKGTRIFNELNEMALKSPFTLIELGTAAKQLTAYNFAADEVVDTTRRLADISAALGVPMERLTYNLGQIKAQGALTARDARDFANAGLAIVPMLADMYTKQKAFGKELTTTADVYDMMSKKMVSYGDVLKVIQQVTDEGGKFFNFQARQADTLKVQMANLSLAYNNMMNEIGADNQGLLSGSIQMVRSLFQNWKTVVNVIQQLIVVFGTYKAVATVVTALNSRMFVGGILVGLRNYIRGIQEATTVTSRFFAIFKSNPWIALASLLAAMSAQLFFFRDKVSEVSQEVELFGENASKTLKKIDTLKKILDGTSDTSSTYKKTLSELSNVMSEYGVKLDAEKANRDEINKATEQTIQLIKEEAAERQRANNIAKGEENYNKGIKDAKDAFYSEISDISDLTDIGGQTKKFRKELEDNAQAISDVVATIVEDNISLVVGKSGNEATKGMLEIQEKVSGAMSSMGISSKATQYLLYNTDILRDLIVQTRKVSEEQLNYNNKIDSYYDAAKKATESTMTFTQKVEANARALQNTSNDALSLYNKIYDIVKIAQQNHTINFDLKLTADNPPKWMLDKSLPELQRLAQRFAAIAQSGGHAEGYNREGTYQQALRYASAARQKQEEAERAARMKNNTKTKKEKDEILDAIKEEISLTKKLQGEYDKLTSKGASHADAIEDVQDRYANTIKLLDKDLGKFGLPKFDTNIITGKDPNKQLEYFKNLRDILESKGLLNLERSKVVNAIIQELDVSAKTFNLDKITKGLNNELDRLKEEYELAVSLDADPELGNMFADWMGIDMNELPRTAQEYAKEYTDILNKYLKDKKSDIKLPNLLDITNDDLRAFQEQADAGIISQEWVDNINKGVKAARDIYKKEASDQIKDWDKLLEKYAEYETKISKIQNDAVKERVTFAQQFGSDEEKSLALDLQTRILAATDPQEKQKLIEQLQNLVKNIAGNDKTKLNIVTAIDNSQEQGIAKANFEEFQKSPEWIIATGDLANLTDMALGGLINSLEEYKKKKKNLDPKQVKQMNSALRNLYRQQRQGNPFLQIANAMNEAQMRAEELKPEMDALMSDIISLEKEIGDNDPTEEQAKHLKSLKDRWKELASVGKVSASEYVNAINNSISAASQAISMFTDMADALGGQHMTEASKTIKDVVGVLEKAGQGAAMGAQIGGGYGAIIGAVAGGLAGAITTWADVWSGNAAITDKVKQSERAVKRLTASYSNLEYIASKAYGAIKSGADDALISNKKLQLAELEHQLELEKSRSSKNRDEERIEELTTEITELRNEIKKATTDIVNDILGISDAEDGVVGLVDAMINAFRNGEDAMAAFGDKWDEMIDNMIIKLLVTTYMQKAWDNVMATLEQKEAEFIQKASEERANAMKEYDYAFDKSDDEIAQMIAERLGYTDMGSFDHSVEEIEQAMKRGELNSTYSSYTGIAQVWIEAWQRVTDEEIRAYRNMLEQAVDGTESSIDKASVEYTKWSLDYMNNEGREYMTNYAEMLKGALGDWYRYGQDSQNNLSALQQGIQGITEDTAGALEAYMNGVSQQVYYQSDILTQIRDILIGGNADIQLGVQGQMLLQLQQSFQVQMAIQSILEGWSSPNGLAVRVEMA